MTTSTNPDSAADSRLAQPPPTAAPAAPTRPRLGTLLVVLVGTFLAGLDFFIVAVALPSIQTELGASSAQVQLIVAGYALAFGCGMITGGRLGDIFGRRKVFAIALALFTLSSVACGLAPNIELLVTSRIIQGLSAALMSPQVLTILFTTYTGEARARAVNAYGVTMGISAVLGQLVGGLLISADVFGLGWRACFLINLPIGIVALALIPKLVPESRAPGRPRLDLVGMVLVTLGLAAVVLPLIEGRQQGWPLWSWVCLAASVPIFAVFARYENWRRVRGGSPLMDLRVFAERAFTVGLLAQLVFWIGQGSFFLIFALYVQQGRGMSALEAGLIFIPIGVGYMATSLTARIFAVKLGRQVIAVGGLLRLVGLGTMLVVVAQIGVSGGIGWLIPALIIDGAGMGLAVAPLAATVLARITPSHAGAATGVLTTGVQVGNAVGVSLIGIIFYQVLASGSAAGDFASAFSGGVIFLLAMSAGLVLLVQLLPRGVGGK
jgi:EmrB/QacA subfamily drug resistance transporter